MACPFTRHSSGRGWDVLHVAPTKRHKAPPIGLFPAFGRLYRGIMRQASDSSAARRSQQDIALREALEERYLAYALSTISESRAAGRARWAQALLHRRILCGMRLLRLDPGSAFKKSAKIVGDVMGTFTHGDQAIYDALVRLAQDFHVALSAGRRARKFRQLSTAITLRPTATPKRV